jgi:hypothetical protein
MRRRYWLLVYWDRGFESRSIHGCLYLCFCVVLSCLCDGLITCPKESYQVILIRLRTVRCEAVKVFTMTAEPHDDDDDNIGA